MTTGKDKSLEYERKLLHFK